MIADLEGMDRRRYAGPVGWIDASGDGEWGIALRTGRWTWAIRRACAFAGCGIVAGSDPEAEVAESDAKLVPMRDAPDAVTRRPDAGRRPDRPGPSHNSTHRDFVSSDSPIDDSTSPHRDFVSPG